MLAFFEPDGTLLLFRPFLPSAQNAKAQGIRARNGFANTWLWSLKNPCAADWFGWLQEAELQFSKIIYYDSKKLVNALLQVCNHAALLLEG